MWKHFLAQAIEKGVPYAVFGDTLQAMNPNKHEGKISSLNLCVAPETKILTRDGYQIISELEGENVDVWNGKEWSPVDVVKTGENQKLISVLTSSNQELVCTEYHKWYVQTGYTNGKIIEKRTHELQKLLIGEREVTNRSWRQLEPSYDVILGVQRCRGDVTTPRYVFTGSALSYRDWETDRKSVV